MTEAFTKRIVRASGCLVVIVQWQSSSLAAQASVFGWNLWRLPTFLLSSIFAMSSQFIY